MGVTDLTTQIEPYLVEKHLMQFDGLRLGIDGHNLLHKMALSSSAQLCNEVPTIRPINGFMGRIRLIEQFNAIPIVVFDGARIPSKAATHEKRESERLKSIVVAKDHDKNGDRELAMKSYKKAFSKASLVPELIKELKTEGITVYVSPYEGDAQLAYMFRKGMIDVAISDDTDLIPYGISRVIFNLDQEGHIKYYDRSILDQYNEVLAKKNMKEGKTNAESSTSRKKDVGLIDLTKLTDHQLILICILKGCDYFRGFKCPHDRLLDFIRDDDYLEMIKKVKEAKNLYKRGDFETEIYEAYMTYKHHIVFDPIKKRVVNLTKLKREDVGLPLPFLGEVQEDDIARDMANGTRDPNSGALYEMENGETVSEKDLQNAWNIWHELSGIGPTDDLNSFKKFDGFLSEYKSLVLPSKLQEGASLHCFLENYDLTYAEGYWTKRFRLSDADIIWENNVLALIEGKICPQEHVLGNRAEMRGKFVEMTLWTKNASCEDIQLRIAKDWKYFTRYEYLMGYALADRWDVVEENIPNKKYIYKT